MVRRPVRALLASDAGRRRHRAEPGSRSGSPPCCPTIRGSSCRASSGDDRRDMLELSATIRRRTGRCWSRPPTMRCSIPAMIDEFCASARRRGHRHRRRRARERCCSGLPDDAAHLAQVPRRRLHRRQPVRAAVAQGRAGDRAVARRSSRTARRAGGCLSLLGPACCSAPRLRLLSIDAGAARSSARKLGLTSRAVELSNPLAGVDVDKPEDHALVEAISGGPRMSDLAIYDMDRTVTRRATYTPFLLHCALRRAPWRLLLPAARDRCRCSPMSRG